MTVVKVKTHSPLQTSQPVLGISQDGSVDAGKVDSRRGYSIWDDDDEE